MIHWTWDLREEGFPCGSAGKEFTCNAGDLGSVPGLGRSPGEGKGYPLQYSVLENSMDYTVHGVTKSQTWQNDFHFHFSEGRERSQCWVLGVETEHLGEQGRLRGKEDARVLFGACHFVNDQPCFPWWTLPFPVGLPFPLLLGDLLFRAPWLRSSVMSCGGPTRRCKLGHLFTSWSELVVVADSSVRNSRIGPKGCKRHASLSFRVGYLSSMIHPPQV